MNFKLYAMGRANHNYKATNVLSFILKNHVGKTITFPQFRTLFLKWKGFLVPKLRKVFNNLVKKFGSDNKLSADQLRNNYYYIVGGDKCVGGCASDSCSGKCCAKWEGMCGAWCEGGFCQNVDT
jgi:hypothetical protein